MSRKATTNCTSFGIITTIFSMIFVFEIGSFNYANASPLQYLPDIAGYVPVYIRHGDEPLEDINPMLAEAFHEPAFKNIREIRLTETSKNQNKILNNKKDDNSNIKEEKLLLENNKLSVQPKILIYTLSQDKRYSVETSALPINEPITIKLYKSLPKE